MSAARILVGIAGAGGGGGGKRGGGGTARAPVEAPDSLRSKQYARVIDLVSEGEILGLVDGAKSIYYDDTPLQNADGSYNFGDVYLEARTGAQAQAPLAGFPASESELAVSLEVKAAVPVVRTVTNPEVDAVRVTVSVPQLTVQDTTTGDLNGNAVAIAIDVQTAGGGYVTRVADTIAGKTVKRYQRSYEIPVSGAGPWDVRVRRLTPDFTAVTSQGQTWWDSYTEIVYDKLTYPNSALVGQMLDASQFASVPRRGYDFYGLIIRVPVNYTPATRAYSGLWDGTFKLAWTDNPAWVFYDLLTNERYGLGAYIDAALVDKWTLYQIAQYCDALVPDGFGGTEPRFTCNLYLQTRQEAYRVLQNVASIFRGLIYWGAGSIVPVQDAPADPTAQFTNANVIDGLFTYAGTARTARHTVALVSWNDPAEGYRQKIEYVEDRDGIARWGVRETEIVAFGCTSRGQAHRTGKWLLASERIVDETVQFAAGLDATYVYPGAIIRTLDANRAGAGNAGRLLGATTAALTLDRSVTLPAGTNQVACVLPDGTLEVRTVATGAGTVSALTVTSAFSAAPAVHAVWMLITPTLEPELWRVVAVQEVEGKKGQYGVAAVWHEPGLYALVEQDVALEARPTSLVQTVPPRPTGLTLSDSIRRGRGGDVVTYLTAAWDQQLPVSGEIRFDVEVRPAGGNWTTYRTYGLTFDAEGVRDGVQYEVNVYAVNALGKRSLPASGTRTIVGKTAPPSDVAVIAITAQLDFIIVSVSEVADADLDYIQIRWSDTANSDWALAQPLGNILRGRSITTADVPTGRWRFFAKAIDTSGNESVSAATTDADVVSAGPITIQRVDNAPDWLGTRTNMVEHWTGVLTPDSTVLASAVGWEVFDQYVHSPAATCSYELVEIDKGVDTTTRLWLDYIATLGPGSAGTAQADLVEADYRKDAGSYDGFEPWTVGSAEFRYAKLKATWDTAAGLPRVSRAVGVVDNVGTRTESAQDVAISAAGTTVTFGAAFSLPPNLQITLVGGASAISYKVTARTVTSFTVACYDAAGVMVAGAIDWKAEGV